MASRLLGVVRFILRLAWVLILSLLCGPPLLFRGALDPNTGPRVLRWFFERCGGAFVKFGQLLASRYDILPIAYCEELAKLLDALRPVPTARIRRCIELELGAAENELFLSFEEKPIATASLAQVHGAVLPGGESVVVKVLKPNIEREVRIDLTCFRLMARILDALPILRGFDIRFVANDLARSILEEMDLRREARNTIYLGRRMSADPVAHYVPAVYQSYSSLRVLTLERIDGISVREIISALNRSDNEKLAAWATMGITPQRTAIILFRSVMEQAIRFRMFNADPHPSNLIVMAGGTLAWVDFGLVGWLDERQWEVQLQLREALSQGREHDAYLAILRGIEPIPENRDLRGFEQEIKRSVRDYILSSDDPNSSILEKSAGVFLMKMLQSLRRSRLAISVSTVALYRTILIADMVMLRLYPQIDWLGHMRRFLNDVSSEVVQGEVEAVLASTYTAYRLARSPQALADTVEWAADRLPQLGRATLHTLSFWERISIAFLRLLRLAAAAAAVVIIVTMVSGSGTPSDSPGSFTQFVTSNAWLALAGCGILFLGLGSLIRRAEST